MTVSELACAGCPSLLVPYPHAIDDHQTANARWLSDAGAAVLLPQSELTAEGLAEWVCRLCESRDQLTEMSRNARRLALPNAARDVANICLEEARVAA